MKVFVAIAFVAIIGFAAAELSAEAKEKLKNYKKECIEQTKIDAAVVEKYKEGGEIPSDAKLGEFLFCFGKKTQFLNEDGSFNVPIIKEKLAQKIGKDVSDVVDKCVAKDEKDGAKNSLAFVACLRKNVPKHEGVF